jgi:putative transposase
MKRAYKERFYPTPTQAKLLAKSFGCARFVYNNTLKWRTDLYYKEGVKVKNSEIGKRLVPLKEEFPWLKEVSNVALQQVLRNQESAFLNFWAGRAKYPTFKKKHSKQAIRLTKSGFRFKAGKLYIAKSEEPLDIRWTRKLPSEVSSISISKDAAGRYFVSMLCEFEPEKLDVSPKTIGIDLGLNHLYIDSEGHKQKNPKYTKKYEHKLAYLQRQLSKKKKGSSNRNKARHKVAKLHAKIADCRRDATHKATRALINENQVICVEDLAVKNMVKNPKLAKHISDANWGEFLRQLEYKADWAGRQIVKIDRWFPSSKRCSTPNCGHIMDSLALDIRSWECPSCNTLHDRDVNAAKNIKTVGLAGLACGATESGV